MNQDHSQNHSVNDDLSTENSSPPMMTATVVSSQQSNDCSTSLQMQWSWIEEHRQPISNELNRLGAELGGPDRRLLRLLANWFAGRSTAGRSTAGRSTAGRSTAGRSTAGRSTAGSPAAGSRGYEQALQHPEVLAICNPLVQARVEDPEASIVRAVRIGFATLSRVDATRCKMGQIFLKPGLLLLVMVLLALFFGNFIVHSFDDILGEFGIQLSQLTDVVLKVGRLISLTWQPVLLVLAITIGLGVLVNLLLRKKLWGRNCFDRWFATKRNVAADWAWHMSMLLEAGVSNQEAVMIASRSQSRFWLTRSCSRWVENQSEKHDRVDNQSQEADNGSDAAIASAADPNRFSFGRFQLLETTLGIEKRQARVELFREIANFYWTQSRSLIEWWASWIMSALFWTWIVVLILMIFALFTPLAAFMGGFL